MKWRPVWIGCLLAALICFVVVFRKMDAMQFNGLRVLSQERLEQMTARLERMNVSEGVVDLLTVDGEKIPYDVLNNTFYVSQSVEKEGYAGSFAAVGEECDVYFQSDSILEDKRTAVADGHRFHLWFVTQEAYAVSDLVFTGLPTISISTDKGRLSAQYQRGTIIVQNPNDHDVITMSVKASDMEVKTNHNSGTISVRLYKKGYQEERDLQLLGLGKRASWKLYPVYEEDGALMREMLSAYVWNCVCGDENLQRNMEYAEVIVDGRYRGLHYLAPKVGKGYLNLEEADSIFKMEGQEKAYDLNAVNIENEIDYHIWMQTVCGVQNGTEDYFLIARQHDGGYEYSRMPDRSKYVFGCYPAQIGWQSLQAAEAVMENDACIEMAKAQGASLEQAMTKKWKEVRDGGLDTEMMLQYAYQCEKELLESGYVTRQINTGGGYQEACLSLRRFVRRRMQFLDGYFEQNEACISHGSETDGWRRES